MAASCAEKGKPAGATIQKSDTLPAATAPTQRMLNAEKNRLDATLRVRAKKKAYLQKVIFMPQEGIAGATRTEQAVNAPTVPTLSPMNVQGLTEDQESRLAGWSGALQTNRFNNVRRRMAASKTTLDARYILVEGMESMKGSNRFTNMFWRDNIVENIRLHRFTPGKYFQK